MKNLLFAFLGSFELLFFLIYIFIGSLIGLVTGKITKIDNKKKNMLLGVCGTIVGSIVGFIILYLTYIDRKEPSPGIMILLICGIGLLGSSVFVILFNKNKRG